MNKQITRAEYRRMLNDQDKTVNHKHGRYHQRTRLYGDYLYHQDRDKFEVDYQEFVTKQANQ